MLKIDVVPTLPTKKGACFDLKICGFLYTTKEFLVFFIQSSRIANLGFLLSQVLPTPLVITSLKQPYKVPSESSVSKPYILKKSIL